MKFATINRRVKDHPDRTASVLPHPRLMAIYTFYTPASAVFKPFFGGTSMITKVITKVVRRRHHCTSLRAIVAHAKHLTGAQNMPKMGLMD
jgi:hypothetical protein